MFQTGKIAWARALRQDGVYEEGRGCLCGCHIVVLGGKEGERAVSEESCSQSWNVSVSWAVPVLGDTCYCNRRLLCVGLQNVRPQRQKQSLSPPSLGTGCSRSGCSDSIKAERGASQDSGWEGTARSRSV